MCCGGDPEVEELQYQNLEPSKRQKKKKKFSKEQRILESAVHARGGGS